MVHFTWRGNTPIRRSVAANSLEQQKVVLFLPVETIPMKANAISVTLVAALVSFVVYKENAKTRKELAQQLGELARAQQTAHTEDLEADRYQLTSNGKRKLDKKTGKVWLLYGSTAKLVTEKIVQKATRTELPKTEQLPSSALSLLTGRGGFERFGESFSVTIHNGTTNWRVHSIEFRLVGSGWNRRYTAGPYSSGFLWPLADGQFIFNAGSIDRSTLENWSIVSAKGFRTTPLQTAQDPSRELSRY